MYPLIAPPSYNMLFTPDCTPNAYHKLIDSIVPSSDLTVFDEADVPRDVDSEDCLFYPLVGCYDGGDGY